MTEEVTDKRKCSEQHPKFSQTHAYYILKFKKSLVAGGGDAFFLAVITGANTVHMRFFPPRGFFRLHHSKS